MDHFAFEFLNHSIHLWTHSEPDHLARSIRLTRGFYELDVLMKCRERHIPGTIIVDVGANIGNHTVFFGTILKADVYAFEPFPANRQLLEFNIIANGLQNHVALYGDALGEHDGSGTSYMVDPTNFGTVSINPGLGDVPVRRLDGLGLAGPIGLLKIDVEGSEVAVIHGAVEMIRKWLPDIVVEAADQAAFAALAEVLLNSGYVPQSRFGWTPTYLFTAVDQPRRLRNLLGAADKFVRPVRNQTTPEMLGT